MPKDQIYILSRCLKRIAQPYGLAHFKFHFNGVFMGHKIRYIIVQAKESTKFELNEDYLLLVKPYIIKDGILLTSLIKLRIIL
jgi:hypothetical protein